MSNSNICQINQPIVFIINQIITNTLSLYRLSNFNLKRKYSRHQWNDDRTNYQELPNTFLPANHWSCVIHHQIPALFIHWRWSNPVIFRGGSLETIQEIETKKYCKYQLLDLPPTIVSLLGAVWLDWGKLCPVMMFNIYVMIQNINWRYTVRLQRDSLSGCQCWQHS